MEKLRNVRKEELIDISGGLHPTDDRTGGHERYSAYDDLPRWTLSPEGEKQQARQLRTISAVGEAAIGVASCALPIKPAVAMALLTGGLGIIGSRRAE